MHSNHITNWIPTHAAPTVTLTAYIVARCVKISLLKLESYRQENATCKLFQIQFGKNVFHDEIVLHQFCTYRFSQLCYNHIIAGPRCNQVMVGSF